MKRHPSKDVAVLFISDALRVEPREGAQVLARELGAHCAFAHGAEVWGPSAETHGGGFLPILAGRFFGWQTLCQLIRYRRHRPSVVYLPQNGLTTATLVRTVLIARLSRARTVDLLVLQHFTRPRRTWRVFARQWRFLVATAEQERLVRSVGLHTSPLYPRVPAVKVSRAATRADARALLGWGEEPQYLHVGHAQRGRNLKSLEALATSGIVRLVISDYRPEEAGSLPAEGSGVQVHRGLCRDLADRYRAADVYVFPTYDVQEVVGLPMSVFEALANGTPVVARRSAALERWANLPHLHLVDDDAELVQVARVLGAKAVDGTTKQPASELTCLGDLRPCAERISRVI